MPLASVFLMMGDIKGGVFVGQCTLFRIRRVLNRQCLSVVDLIHHSCSFPVQYTHIWSSSITPFM